jgi:hypothetical protein
VNAANCWLEINPQLLSAARNLQESWPNNLTESMARLNEAVTKAETIKRKEIK